MIASDDEQDAREQHLTDAGTPDGRKLDGTWTRTRFDIVLDSDSARG